MLTNTGEYRVLRRFRQRSSYADAAPPADAKIALYLDVETTGLDVTRNRIIEFAVVPFQFDGTGAIYGLEPGFTALEDPGEPVPMDVRELTGITDEMVRGQRIDDGRVAALVARAALVIAHNADFDRRVVERRFPFFRDTYWACSQKDVPWMKLGCRSTRLENILLTVCGEFHGAHRALDDCLAGVHVLATASLDGRNAMSHLLERARRPTHRLWALQAPFEAKDQLKARHYRWSDGSEGRHKCWYRDLAGEELDAELAWLREVAYGGAATLPCRTTQYTAKDRYSSRV